MRTSSNYRVHRTTTRRGASISTLSTRFLVAALITILASAGVLYTPPAEACAPPPTYTLTLSFSGSGSVNLNPPNTTYTADTVQSYSLGTNVTLTATPSAGYAFDHWSGDLTGSTNPATIGISTSISVTAVFVAQTYTLTTSVTGSGAVSPSSGSYGAGTSVTMTATPATGWRFDHWIGGLTGSANPASLTMNANKSVTAVFTQQFELYVGYTGWGTINASPPGGIYDAGTVVSITAVPGAGWRFDHWLADLAGTTNPTTLTMNSSKMVIAYFVQRSAITSSVTGTGTISLSPAGGTYDTGTNVTVTATPGSGWRFDHWTGDLTGSANPAPLQMDGNKTVNAVFIQRFTLTTTTTGTGTVSLSPSGGTYDTGTNVTVTATPGAGWRFDHWTGDLTGSDNPVPLLMNGNKTVNAVFVQRFTLSTATSGTGTIALSPSGGTYDAGTNVTVTATPGSGWCFDHWEGGLTGTTNPSVIPVTGNLSIAAVFVPACYLTTATTKIGNSDAITHSGTYIQNVSINPSGGYYAPGTIVTLVPVPSGPFHFAYWTGDLTGTANPGQLTLNTNKSVTAVFETDAP